MLKSVSPTKRSKYDEKATTTKKKMEDKLESAHLHKQNTIKTKEKMMKSVKSSLQVISPKQTKQLHPPPQPPVIAPVLSDFDPARRRKRRKKAHTNMFDQIGDKIRQLLPSEHLASRTTTTTPGNGDSPGDPGGAGADISGATSTLVAEPMPNMTAEQMEDYEAEIRRQKSFVHTFIPIYRSTKHRRNTPQTTDLDRLEKSLSSTTTTSSTMDSLDDQSDGYSPSSHIRQLIADLGCASSPRPPTKATQSKSKFEKMAPATINRQKFISTSKKHEKSSNRISSSSISNLGNPSRPPETEIEIARARERAQHLRAKQVFDPCALGRDEDEFVGTRLHRLVCQYVPDDMAPPPPVSQPSPQPWPYSYYYNNGIGNSVTGAAPPPWTLSASSSRAPHRIAASTFIQNPVPAYLPGRRRYCPSCCCCCCCGAFSGLDYCNCGVCYSLKMFVIITLIVAMLLVLWDPCFGFGVSSHSPADYPSIDRNTTTTTTVRSTTIQKQQFYPSSLLASFAQFHDEHDKEEGHYRANLSAYSSSSLSSPSASSFFDHSSITASPHEYRHEAKNCMFKICYLICILIGIMVYLSIFFTYSCQLVVRYYNSPWFLYECALCTAYSAILLFASIAAYFVAQNPLPTTMLLIDSLLGLVLGMWTYGNHSAGVTPLLSVTTPDPDMDQIAQILGRKQFYKLFEFQTKRQQLQQISSPENNNNNNNNNRIIIGGDNPRSAAAVAAAAGGGVGKAICNKRSSGEEKLKQQKSKQKSTTTTTIPALPKRKLSKEKAKEMKTAKSKILISENHRKKMTKTLSKSSNKKNVIDQTTADRRRQPNNRTTSKPKS